MKLIKRLALFSFLLLLAACNRQQSPASNEAEEERLGELTVGLMASFDSFPIAVAYYNGYFEDEKLTVNLVPFVNAQDRDAAMAAGEIEGSNFDLVAVGLSQEAGINPLQVTGQTSGRFTLVARNGITDFSGLAGETVLISSNTAIDLTLDHMIGRAGYPMDHIERMAVPAMTARLEVLRAGEDASAALLPEPWASVMLAEDAVAIQSTLDIGFNPFVSAFTKETIANKPAELQAFYRAFNRAVDFINENELEDFFHILVEVSNFPASVVINGEDVAMTDIIELPYLQQNGLPPQETLEIAIEWLEGRGLITPGTIAPEDLINDVAFQ